MFSEGLLWRTWIFCCYRDFCKILPQNYFQLAISMFITSRLEHGHLLYKQVKTKKGEKNQTPSRSLAFLTALTPTLRATALVRGRSSSSVFGLGSTTLNGWPVYSQPSREPVADKTNRPLTSPETGNCSLLERIHPCLL